MLLRLKVVLVLLAMLLPLHYAHAVSGFRVTPLRLDLSARQKTTFLELTNLSQRSMNIEVKLFEWEQVSGKDVYRPSKDLFFAPPITRVPSGAKKTVRFRLTAAPDKRLEKSYRVYVKHLPTENAPSGTTFNLQMGIPVFIKPKEFSSPQFTTQAIYDAASQAIRLTMSNVGNIHIKVKSIGLFTASAMKRGVERLTEADHLASANQSLTNTNYILPNATQQWVINAQPPLGDDYALLLSTDVYNAPRGSQIDSKGLLWVPVKTKIVQ